MFLWMKTFGCLKPRYMLFNQSLKWLSCVWGKSVKRCSGALSPHLDCSVTLRFTFFVCPDKSAVRVEEGHGDIKHLRDELVANTDRKHE